MANVCMIIYFVTVLTLIRRRICDVWTGSALFLYVSETGICPKRGLILLHSEWPKLYGESFGHSECKRVK